MGFSNPPLDIEGLPRLDDDQFVALHPDYLKLSLVGPAIAAVVVLAAGAVGVVLAEIAWIPLAIAAALLVLTALWAWLRRLAISHLGYQIREHDISFRDGVISRRVATLPFVRVQHASVSRGPLERPLGLATLSVNSAGPDLLIPGLPVADAERMKTLVVERAGALDEAP